MDIRRASPTRRLKILLVASIMFVLPSVPARARVVDPPTPVTTTTLRVPVPPRIPPAKPLTANDVKEIHNIDTKDPVIFITVDDGNQISPQLAAYLDATNLPITTFFISYRLRQYKNFWLARKNVTFENHSLTHRFMGSLSLRGQIREVCGASAAIKSITGQAPRYFRPPGGSRNKTLKTALARCGIKYLVMWKASAARGKLYTWGNRSLERGDIVLLHALKSLPQTLAVVVAAAKKQGLHPALLRDYLK